MIKKTNNYHILSVFYFLPLYFPKIMRIVTAYYWKVNQLFKTQSYEIIRRQTH